MKVFLISLTIVFSVSIKVCAQWEEINSQAISSYERGDFQQSIILGSEALRLAEESSGKMSESYLTSLSNLAYAQSGKGDLSDALKNFLNSLAISQKLYQEAHISQMEATLEVSKAYISLAKYDSSEYYLGLAVQIYISAYEQNRSYYDSTVDSWNRSYIHLNGAQAILFHRKGQVQEAISTLEVVIDEMKRLYPQDFKSWTEYRTTINNLAVYMNEVGDFEQAKMYAIQYEDLISDDGDILDEIYALKSLGDVYRNLGHDSANVYWSRATQLIENSTYRNESIYAILLNNLGEFALEREVYDSAISYTKASLDIQESKQTVNPRIYKTTLFNLAEAYRWNGEYDKADEIFGTLIDDMINDVKYNFTFLSDNEKMAFYNTQKDVLESYTVFALEISGLLPLQDSEEPYIAKDILGRLYNLQLQTKAIILNASKRMRKRILESEDDTLIQNYHLWEQLKNELANSLLDEHVSNADVQNLKSQIEVHEKWLTVNSRNFNSGFVVEDIHWQDIQQALKPDEAAVEIISFLNGLVYGALVITPETVEQPMLALMMSTQSKHLNKEFYKQYRNSIQLKIEDTLSYQKYWSPIKQVLIENSSTGKMPQKVYLSNDGIYNQVNLNTLYDAGHKRYVIDETDIVLLTNTKELLVSQYVNSNQQAILFGQPEFTTSENAVNTFSDLPGTGLEVKRVDEILKKSGWHTVSYVGLEATENELKDIYATQVLHIASHGFFESNQNEQSSLISKMMQSGIALVGANDLHTKDEDGLMTAFEVLSMDLDSTQLVVLSACETGQGSLVQSEGIYGLQRAVRVAGASNMIMSLWKVDDFATQELMTAFYEYWMVSDDIHVAFRKAQQELREKYPEPYYWGAFVLAGK